MEIAIIGAGPAGLSCAIELARSGHNVTVFEADSCVGGLSRTIPLWDMLVDYGPHRFFTMNKTVADYWINYIQDDYIFIDRLTRIFYKEKFFEYPLKPFNAFVQLGLIESIHCALSYFKASLQPKGNEASFAQWVSRRFGHRLYEIFFKTYSEKLWGISCDELDADFAAQRIKGLNLYEAVKCALFKGKPRHKTLVEQFAFPRYGAGEVYERMGTKLVELGGKICLSTPVRHICFNQNRINGVETANGFFHCDHVVSTMPITDLVKQSPGFAQTAKDAANRLTYRNTILVYLLVKKSDLFRDNWIYVHDTKLQTGRITNFRNWSPAMYDGHAETILMMEYWSYDHEPLWQMKDSQLVALARHEIVSTGLVQKEVVGEGHIVRIHRSYPVYSKGYEKNLKIIQNSIDNINGLACIGRNGSFKYNNQDHSILMGLLAAENICKDANHNLWLVNTDYDYQEGKSAFNNGEIK